ncbi:uncharacterized protein LOC134418552 isoform X2 [Melospiza melodia melodia]|uniref:uncharacterized protein LOC134418552 isoform X2 n=1 Tax=Melospiza melodia melodia TaxID=1914991 RepID=UPI002FD1104C
MRTAQLCHSSHSALGQNVGLNPRGQEKSPNSSHLCQKLWCLGSQRQEASAPGLCWRALVLPTLWVSQGWHREWCRCRSGSGAAALWSHFKGCPCWSTLVPAIPWDTEGALSQVALAPWQECGSSPRAAGAPAGKGQEDPCGMRLERASRGAASGWRRAKGPTWCHQGTCEEQNGHLEATWRKGMHIPVFSTPPVGPTCESFPPLVHLQLDPEKLQTPSH